MDDYEIHRKAKNNNRLSGLLEASERYDSSSLNSNENGRTAGNIDSLDREALQAERQSDRYGYRKDADNDNTSKKRYSRDVDYAEYADLKRENKHLKEVQSIDVLYAVNEKITALFLKNKRLFFALLDAGCLSDKPFVYIFIIIQN